MLTISDISNQRRLVKAPAGFSSPRGTNYLVATGLTRGRMNATVNESRGDEVGNYRPLYLE